MNENNMNGNRLEMLEAENQLLKQNLRLALEELEKYKEKYGENLDESPSGKNVDFKQMFATSKDKLQEKMKEEKMQDRIDKGKEMTDKAKKKVSEGSAIALDALKTAKNVFFNKDFQQTLKDEFNKQRNKKNDDSQK